MKKSYRISIKVISLIIFLLVVLFPNYIYSIQKNNNLPSEVIVGGELLQLSMKSDKLIIKVEEDRKLKIKNQDVVKKIEGDALKRILNKTIMTDITRKDILNIRLNMKDNEEIKMTVLRNEEKQALKLNKKDLNPSYFIEKIPFSASLTYINPIDKSFGAIGHNIEFAQNSNVILESGDIFLCNSKRIKQSNNNEIGNMYGEKIYSSQGTISKINDFGAKGKIIGEKIVTNQQIYKVGKKEEVKEGIAQLLIQEETDKVKKAYEIKITKVNKQKKPNINGFEFEVIDKEFIESYGGIVQGMSGCPIIQDGKIIGALSHVICKNPKYGIGVYIQWMMED